MVNRKQGILQANNQETYAKETHDCKILQGNNQEHKRQEIKKKLQRIQHVNNK